MRASKEKRVSGISKAVLRWRRCVQVEQRALDVFSWTSKVKGSQVMRDLLEDGDDRIVDVSPTDAKVDTLTSSNRGFERCQH